MANIMQSCLTRCDIDQLHSIIDRKERWRDVMNISAEDRCALAQELLSHKNYFDPKNNKIDEIVTFLMLSFSYEPLDIDEKTQAREMANIALSYESEGRFPENRIQIAKILARHYFAEIETPSIITWELSSNATSQDVRLYKGALAFHSTFNRLEDASDRFVLKGAYNGASTVIGIKESYLKESDFKKLSQTLFHEFRHERQRQNTTPIDAIQRNKGVFERVIKIMPETAYFALMAERQAFVFDGWVEDVMDGKSLRAPDQIIMDEMARQNTFDPRFIAKMHEFTNSIALASQSRAMTPRVEGCSRGRTPQLSSLTL